jgi:hypothetical protein
MGKLKEDKKGQSLNINTLIIIILAIVVLVILILGFTLGWNKLAPWLNKNNIQSIADSCNIACSTQSSYDFCFTKRELNDGTNKLKDVTCVYLSEKKPEYGIAKCLSITCMVVFEKAGCKDADEKLKSDFFLQTLNEENKLISNKCQ